MIRATFLFVVALSLGMALTEARDDDALPIGIHPKVFNLIGCWISDSASPVVTEINLDAVDSNGNQFLTDGVKREGDWLRFSDAETHGFMRYRVVDMKGNTYKVEYQENGGGSLTTSALIGFVIEKREIKIDGKSTTIHVLKVLSYTSK
ncbi:hypothetical protein BH09VER1_BH09VER1_32220 [soil metagenome]